LNLAVFVNSAMDTPPPESTSYPRLLTSSTGL
jgi:hypothetical protein